MKKTAALITGIVPVLLPAVPARTGAFGTAGNLTVRTANTVRKLCRGEAGGETDGTQASY